MLTIFFLLSPFAAAAGISFYLVWAWMDEDPEPGLGPFAALREVSWGVWLGLGLVALAAVGLRAWNLDSYGPGMDEQIILAGAWDSKTHPPLSLILASLFSSTSLHLWATRLPSLVFGLATVLGLALVHLLRGRPRAAIWAALLLAGNLEHVRMSQHSEGYALLTLLVLAGGLCVSLAVKTGRRRWWWGWAIVIALSGWTHYLAPLYFAGGFLGATVLAGWRRIPWRGLAWSLGAAALALVPLVPFALQSGPVLELQGGPPLAEGLSECAEALTGLRGWPAYGLGGLLLLASLIALRSRSMRLWGFGLFSAVLLLEVAIPWEGGPHVRQLSVLFPLVYLLLGDRLSRLPDRVAVSGAVILVAIGLSPWTDFEAEASRFPNHEYFHHCDGDRSYALGIKLREFPKDDLRVAVVGEHPARYRGVHLGLTGRLSSERVTGFGTPLAPSPNLVAVPSTLGLGPDLFDGRCFHLFRSNLHNKLPPDEFPERLTCQAATPPVPLDPKLHAWYRCCPKGKTPRDKTRQ